MRSRTAQWFECKVRYEKVTEEGLQKKVTEQYVVDALSFSEAEQRITEEMSAYISGEYEITDVRKAPYKEVFFSDGEMDEPMEQREQNQARLDSAESRQRSSEAQRYFKAKLQFITIDEKTEKEKRANVTYLVQAATFDGAVKNINEVMGSTMIDFEKSNIAETKIIDVFEYAAKEKNDEEPAA